MGSQSPGLRGGGDVSLYARPRGLHRLTGAGATLSLLGRRRVTTLLGASSASGASPRPSSTSIVLGHAPNLLSRSLGRRILSHHIVQPLPVPRGGPHPNNHSPPRSSVIRHIRHGRSLCMWSQLSRCGLDRDLVSCQMMVRPSRDKVPPSGEDLPLKEVCRGAGISRPCNVKQLRKPRCPQTIN
ncbi:hypothetical protein PIB30_002449 [Stylosanthes scabra]|uniref:Uncharacterized protein n=1 Tax=Stylosanthes scabra TaxID=79078 RepID=A0ABU6W2P3_9FABA|nr:hypothetical protein [Stylosanthes scabra]